MKNYIKKRPLLVFAGQSNMMGAATFPPTVEIETADSYEYKHKPKRLGKKRGEFVPAGYPCGEFSYTDEIIKSAYLPQNTDSSGKSLISCYSKSTYFCPAMSNLTDIEIKSTAPFDAFSESNYRNSPSIAPLFAMEYERHGCFCTYAHIAKGGVSINHYLIGGSFNYFNEKVKDFFTDSEELFKSDDTSCKILVWCQGESDAGWEYCDYLKALNRLWQNAQALGFTHFFCVRIGNWIHDGESKIYNVMKAQEDFCLKNENCYMMTRAMSCMPNKNADGKDWFAYEPPSKYQECRDNNNGFGNDHINEKGFAIIAEVLAENTYRVLDLGVEPMLEKEPVKILSDYHK